MGRSRTRSSAVATSLLLLAAAPAVASISSFTGPIEQIAPPAVVQLGISYASAADTATIWDEQQDVLVSNLAMSMINNPGSSTLPTPGSVSGVVDSHYLHYRHVGQQITGTITFDGQIVGVAFDNATLYPSDPILGPTGTTYDQTGDPRGISQAIDSFSINQNVLTFSIFGEFQFFQDTVEFRVLTAPVPAPGTLVLIGLGGLVAARRRCG